MATYEDYLPGGSKYTGPEEVLETEIEAAEVQQEERVSTPVDVDWEKRYTDLEVAYSRQGQQMGDYRALIDEHISTPDTEATGPTEVSPITPDDIYEDPDAAVRRAIDSHPAIQEAKELKQELANQKAQSDRNDFVAKFPNMQETIASPEFANWVNEDPTRLELARRADGWDLASADALFTMYDNKAPAVAEAPPVVELESGYGSEAPAPEQYSRSAMLQQKIRAKQGDYEAQAYVKAHGAAYRIALGEGNVRD